LLARLIAGGQTVRVCNAKFGVIAKEGWIARGRMAQDASVEHRLKLDFL